MPREEVQFLLLVKGIMSFREGEVQWDAGVCHSSVSQQHSSLFLFVELSRAHEFYPLFQLCRRRWLLPRLLIMNLP